MSEIKSSLWKGGGGFLCGSGDEFRMRWNLRAPMLAFVTGWLPNNWFHPVNNIQATANMLASREGGANSYESADRS